MGKHITNTTVSRTKPGDKPYEIRDTELKGLLLRVQPSGVMTYYLEYQRGKRVKIGSADTLAADQARDIARGIDAQRLVTGQDPIEQKKRVKAGNYIQFIEDTYKSHLEAHLRNGVDNLENVKETLDCLKNRFPEFHDLGLNEITPLLIDKWKQRRMKEGKKPSTLNRQMNDLRACLNKAVEWEVLDKSPFDNKKVKPCKTDSSPKVRYLSEDEETKLRRALDDREAEIKAARDSANEWRKERGFKSFADLKSRTFVDHVKPAILLSLNTGMRRGELLKTKWSDISFKQKNLTVPADIAKGGKTRHIPLNDEALSILNKWKKQQKVTNVAGYVFSDDNGQPFHDMNTSWRGVLTKAEITGFRWHDMRHSFASKLVMAGVDLNTVRELLGHSDYKMTLRYSHLAPEHKAAAVAKLISVKSVG